MASLPLSDPGNHRQTQPPGETKIIMKQTIQLRAAVSQLTSSVNRSPLRRHFLVGALALLLAWFGLLLVPNAFGVSPAPDGGYLGGNTAEGHDALFSLTNGVNNTAVGFDVLYYNTARSNNTANGFSPLLRHT